MKTLIVHDNGEIIATMHGGEYDAPAVLVTDIPVGYNPVRVDMKTGEVVTEPAPKTAEQRIAELEAEMAALLGTEEV